MVGPTIWTGMLTATGWGAETGTYTTLLGAGAGVPRTWTGTSTVVSGSRTCTGCPWTVTGAPTIVATAPGMIWPGSNGQVAQGTDCDAQETPADEHADDSTWLCTPLHVCTQVAMAVLVPEPQELEQGVNGATLHEKVGQQGRAGQGCVWEVHAAPHIDAGTVEPLPGPETVVHVATFILEPACPQVPEQEPWRLYVHEYSEQIGTVQGDVWVWQPPGQFDAAVGVEGPPQRF